jgi:hypothetical protein
MDEVVRKKIVYGLKVSLFAGMCLTMFFMFVVGPGA